MKISASIELVIQFATYEAMAGQFREIEPEHLLMALLKFPELPIGEMEKLAPGAGAKEIAKEVDAVCKELSRRAIESKKIRRELRAKMGRGNSPFSGGRIHRSSASRQIFDVAGKLADDAGSEAITAEYILEALMIAPTPRIEGVLGSAVGARVEERKDTPLLDRYGKDLTKAAAGSNSSTGEERTAEGKALIKALSQSSLKSVFLITEDEHVAEQTVTKAAQIIATNDDCSALLKSKKIINVSEIKSLGKWDKQMLEEFDRLCEEAASLENTILLVPAVDRSSSASEAEDWLGFLRKMLTQKSVQCICRVTPDAYQKLVKSNSSWKRLVNIIWIHDRSQDEVPWEL